MTRYCANCGQPTALERPNLYVCPSGHRNFLDSAPSAGAYIIRDGKVLFGRRSIEPHAGGLNIPGGFIEIPENAEAAVAREVKEEMGIDIKLLDILGTYHSTYGADNRDVLIIVFVATYDGGQLSPADDMNGGKPAWRAIDNLPESTELSFDWQLQAQKDLQAWYEKHGSEL